MKIEVIGVHPVSADEPCHLIEVQVDGGDVADAIYSITQEHPDRPPNQWQVAWAEHYLSADGTNPGPFDSVDSGRVAFFFHYLELSRPLSSAAGPLSLPSESPRPKRLRFIRYFAP
jgi:hypothetical protein